MYHNHNNSLIFGTKIQIHNFGHFSKNSIFGQNLRFSDIDLIKWDFYHDFQTTWEKKSQYIGLLNWIAFLPDFD